MVKKTFEKKDKKGREESWEWEQTPEVIAALEQLRKSSEEVENV